MGPITLTAANSIDHVLVLNVTLYLDNPTPILGVERVTGRASPVCIQGVRVTGPSPYRGYRICAIYIKLLHRVCKVNTQWHTPALVELTMSEGGTPSSSKDIESTFNVISLGIHRSEFDGQCATPVEEFANR